MKLALLLLILPACDTAIEPEPFDCGICLGHPVRRLHCDVMSSGYCAIRPGLGIDPGLYDCVTPDEGCAERSEVVYPWAAPERL